MLIQKKHSISHTSRCIAIWSFRKSWLRAERSDQTGGNDFKNTGAINFVEGGNKLTQYRVDATPLDGLNIGADYATESGETLVQLNKKSQVLTTLNMHLNPKLIR